MGWVVHRHGALYSQEYGWDERFEALVATIVAKFIDNLDPKRERCWIAERDGEIVGLGVPRVEVADGRAAEDAVRRAEGARARNRRSGLPTNANASRARRATGRSSFGPTASSTPPGTSIEAAGYRLVAEEPHHSFGQRLIGQTWELKL